MEDILQICMGMLGASGFALLFHVRKEKLVIVAVGGALSWMVYLLVVKCWGDKSLGLFVSTVTVAFFAELLARIVKAPVTVLLVPMLVPLIPGSDLYYTTSYFLQGQMSGCVERLESLMQSIGAISFGVICITCSFQVVNRMKIVGKNCFKNLFNL